MVLETDPNLALCMRRDGQPRLRLYATLAEVDVLVRARVHNFNVHSLVLTRSDVGRDDNQCAVVNLVPDAFLRWVAESRKVEFDSNYGMHN